MVIDGDYRIGAFHYFGLLVLAVVVVLFILDCRRTYLWQKACQREMARLLQKVEREAAERERNGAAELEIRWTTTHKEVWTTEHQPRLVARKPRFPRRRK